ncbi:MAG: hydroxyacid dehydrogenase [Acidobacteria bacterium]|nr:hydroxyacid dehydrogenase [Acidobacteriota bacterium]
MPCDKLIVATSASFSKDPMLVERLRRSFPCSRVNTDARRYTADELRALLHDADGAIVGLDLIDEDVVRECPRLKIVAKYGVGLDNIDSKVCERYGITIGWTGGVNRLSVAEVTIGFMLALCRRLYYTSTMLKAGAWIKDGGVQLSGRTVGIVGVGHVGKEVVRLLQPFRCRMLVNDIVDQSDYYRANGLIAASKERLFAESDIVTIHTPLTPETRCMINATTIGTMRRTAFLINTARGPIVDGGDLKRALQHGTIAGAALDVYEQEPPSDQELIANPRLICTPHIGGNAFEAIQAMGLSAIDHLEQFFGVSKGRS